MALKTHSVKIGNVSFTLEGVASMTKERFRELFDEHWKLNCPSGCNETWKTLMRECKKYKIEVKK